MLRAQRCGAKTRSGEPCRAPAISGAAHCRMHGGRGSGAPKGNRNALTDGLHTASMRAVHRMVRSLMREANDAIREHVFD